MQNQNSRALVEIHENPINSLTPLARNFYEFHGIQMIGSQFPSNLVGTLHLKLTDLCYDGGQFFQIIDNEEESTYEVRATKHIPAKGNVFVIDHAMTFRYPELRKILKQNAALVKRLESMLKYQTEEKELPQSEDTKQNEGESIELESLDLMQLGGIELPKTLVTLSLMYNRLENVEQLIAKLQYLNLRVLWVNGNPLADSEDLQRYVFTKTRIELFNSKFTPNTTEWGLKYAHSKSIRYANETEKDEINSLNLDGRNIFQINLNILESFEKLHYLSIKQHEVSSEEEMNKILRIISIPSLLFLMVDEQLELKIRECFKKGEIAESVVAKRVLVNKHGFQQELAAGEDKIDAIVNSIFRIAGCYRLASPQKLDQSSIWYINDELGSAIPHNDKPNIKIIPFLYAPHNKLDEDVVAYSILWPLVDIKEGDLITRDYLNGLKQDKQRSSRLSAWYKLPQEFYLKSIEQYDRKMLELSKDSIGLLEKFYSQNAIRQKEVAGKAVDYQKKYRVISDYQYINKFLKHERFQIVSELDKADIVWLTAAAEEEEWNKFKGKYFLNQFPFESCIVLKHNLAHTVQSVFGDTKFLQRTYDLEKELSLFIGDYYQREKQGVDNLWILKPPNMARSMDMIITDNLPLIIRAMQTGPKIAQKYISQPVLRRGRKVDLRYILLVKSIAPLTLFLYKNFWIRSANNPYTLDRRDLATYETQFTVMNYGKVSNFEQIKYKDFIAEFEKDYEVKWASINEKIKKMLRNVFIAVATKYPQMHDDFSRAVYGIDIMVDSETMEPKLLEITFSPDCKRACDYYPTFYDEIFQTLFLESMSQNMERII